MKSEDDETLSQKEIFDNCSSTVGGKSPGNSIISNLSTEMEKFSINITTCPQKNKSSVHNSTSMKELSSSNHPTHSSTNIETQIPPVNLPHSKKDSSKSDHSTLSPTKNESGVSLKNANIIPYHTNHKNAKIISYHTIKKNANIIPSIP